MKRRALILTAAALPLLAAPRIARASLAPLLSQAGSMPPLRAIALWQDDGAQGVELAAQGYHGFTPGSPTNIKSASKSVVSAQGRHRSGLRQQGGQACLLYTSPSPRD